MGHFQRVAALFVVVALLVTLAVRANHRAPACCPATGEAACRQQAEPTPAALPGPTLAPPKQPAALVGGALSDGPRRREVVYVTVAAEQH
jgi:hypothetical protein